MSAERLTLRIRETAAKGRCALIPFITAGFPDPQSFAAALAELDKGGAPVIEIGVPFSDPVADGPLVEAATLKALDDGVTLDGLLDELRRIKSSGGLKAGLVLVGYYNPFFRHGLERFAAEAREAGVDGCVVHDLPLDESDTFRAALAKEGIALILPMGLNIAANRLARYAAKAQGYARIAPVPGSVPPGRPLPPDLAGSFAKAKSVFSVPLALGLGEAGPEGLCALASVPEAAVLESALMAHMAAGGAVAEFMRKL